MLDFEYNGTNYRLVKNKALFNCYNVLFAGYMYIESRRYKKYVSANNVCYLVED